MHAAAVPSILTSLIDEAHRQGTPFLLVALFLASVLSRMSPAAAELRTRVRFITVLFSLHAVLLPATALAVTFGADFARDLRLVGSVISAITFVAALGLLGFGLLLPRLRISMPRILQDVVIAMLGTIAVFGTASRAGLDLSGIVATGAVLAAVIGLALQDTLGNIVGGLSLQLDDTIRVGDWIRVADVTGRVSEIRWRSASIETRNWETIVLPNSLLTRSQVVVLGRRAGQDPRWRRWVYFNIDFRFPPSQVIQLATNTLSSQPIDNVATTPAPDCVLIDLGESTARYAVRYYLLDFAPDDPTDSVVRTRLYFALQRAGIPLSMPAHAIFMTEESAERRTHKQEAEHERRMRALRAMDLFRDLSEPEYTELADDLQRAPFARGEVLTRQGAEAHHLYMIYAGSVSVRVREDEHDREVAQLTSGACLGEMSLLTGEKRSATVVALTDVESYRLDAGAFRRLLERRPDLAQKVAAQLAERRVELLTRRDQLLDRKSLVANTERDMLQKIREFFRL